MALKFDFDAFAAFDLFIMNRKNSENDYTKLQLERAQKYFYKMTSSDKEKLVNTIVKGLPGREGPKISIVQNCGKISSTKVQHL